VVFLVLDMTGSCGYNLAPWNGSHPSNFYWAQVFKNSLVSPGVTASFWAFLVAQWPRIQKTFKEALLTLIEHPNHQERPLKTP
jgi:hypothetical protein